MKFENSYWAKKGKHQAEHERLYKKLVPAMGPASTKPGQLLRHACNVYYDLYNNGGGNLIDARSGDLLYVMANVDLNTLSVADAEYVMAMLNHIASFEPHEDELDGEEIFPDRFEAASNLLIDAVVQQVAKHCEVTQ